MQPMIVDGVAFAHVCASEDDVAEVLTAGSENALKYAPRPSLRIALARGGDQMRAEVAGRGTGMPAGDMHAAFARLFCAERRGDVAGSGLGLALATRAIGRAGGTVAIESTANAETTFISGLSIFHSRCAARVR